MGICASCLGYERRESGSEVDAQHLLSDPYQPQYGTANQDNRHGPQIDPEEIRRQRDVLERLCAQTSDKLIDVTQPSIPSSSAVQTSDSKVGGDYLRLFAERFGPTVARTQTWKRYPTEEEYEEEGGSSNRPESRSAIDTAEIRRDERERLRRLLYEEQGKEALEWRRTGAPGALSITFDDVL